MAQRQQEADVHQDDLCPLNKRYDLMDANKKVDLENVQCPSKSKILMNIITNHLSKNRLKFLLDRKELTLTLNVQEKEEETRKATEVEPDIVIPVNVDDDEEEITDEVFELRRRAKGKNVEESRISTIPSPTRSPRNFSTL
ncbi:hypothetical protein Tco_1097647, partial [Tanacetum coccineum]